LRTNGGVLVPDVTCLGVRRRGSPSTSAGGRAPRVKDGIRERFAEPRVMGIRTIMITGDNQLTAAAIAAEAGADDFLAEAAPEDKMALIPPGADRGSAGRDDRGRH
jgi:haloacid dehalogenase-like hydrolase